MGKFVAGSSGRDREVARIRQANKACAAGRLLLGEIRSWQEFLEAETLDLASLPRRNLKAGSQHVSQFLAGEIARFCRQNFAGMTEAKLAELFEAVKASRGIELPLEEFEARFGRLSPERGRGVPRHATVCISLWGLKFKFPEDFLSKDIIDGLARVRDSERQLAAFDRLGHADLSRRRAEIAAIISQREFCARSCILATFNLVEAFLNGLAWDFAHDAASMARLSKRQQELISDSHGATLREKIAKYPDIIAGLSLSLGDDLLVVAFLNEMKPLRDALVHPSPFSSPAKFGGRDKLRAFYRADAESAEPIAAVAIEIITRVWDGVGAGRPRPGWLSELRSLIGERIGDASKEWGLVATASTPKPARQPGEKPTHEHLADSSSERG
jgi:hypothetical protein